MNKIVKTNWCPVKIGYHCVGIIKFVLKFSCTCCIPSSWLNYGVFFIIVIEYRLVLQKGFKVLFFLKEPIGALIVNTVGIFLSLFLLTSLHLLIDNSDWTDILKL